MELILKPHEVGVGAGDYSDLVVRVFGVLHNGLDLIFEFFS